MVVVVLFWAITALCCGYCIAIGSRDARSVAILYLAAIIMTLLAQLGDTRWIDTNHGVMWVDLGFFLGLYWLALRSQSYWPLWMTGFQLVALATHLASMAGPPFEPRLYAAMSTFWSIPMFLAMLIGVVLDNRSGLHRSAAPAPAPHSNAP